VAKLSAIETASDFSITLTITRNGRGGRKKEKRKKKRSKRNFTSYTIMISNKHKK
jgi:hypothetical protein